MLLIFIQINHLIEEMKKREIFNENMLKHKFVNR